MSQTSDIFYPLQIVLITGRKRSGKTTLGTAMADHLRSAGRSVFFSAFANRLKWVLDQLTMYHFLNDTWLDKNKEKPFSAPIDIDALLLPRWDEMFPSLAPPPHLGLQARTPRELMQMVGTEYVRRQDDAYWTKALIADSVAYFKRIDSGSSVLRSVRRVAIVPDLRFVSEYQGMLAFAQQSTPTAALLDVIRLRRSDEERVSADTHASEVELERIPVDIGLTLPSGSGELLQDLGRALAARRCL